MSYGPKQTPEEGYNKFVIKNIQVCWDWSGYAPKNPKAKFICEQIKEIRKSKLNNKQISKKYKVASSTIGSIKRNLSWKEGVNY